ncbi:ATP-grasp domain-containing protein [bacterium]|nr:ATP-grasp domain-containing protein [bacterium]
MGKVEIKELKSVFLTNGQLRKTLAAARSLGSRGINVTVAEETRFNPAAFSKYCQQSLVCPNARDKPDEFYNWLVKSLKANPSDVLFPMDDDTMDVVMKHRDELQKICYLPLPSTESYAIASDKGKTVELAKEAGIYCPRTVLPENVDNITEVVSYMKYPLIIKPRKSSGSRGICIVTEKDRLKEEYLRVHSKYPYPIVQEYIGTGDRYDVCLLFDEDHRLKASFVQKEIRHFPIDIGPSTVQESVYLPELVKDCLKLMAMLKWIGVVELEFMVDAKDGKMKLMEINPRFWNSLYLSILAGVDFPWLLYKVAIGEDFQGVFEYKRGIRCKWLLPGDLLHFLFNKERFKMNPPLLGGKKHNIKDDIASFDDPMPVLGFVFACLRYLADKKMWETMFKR